jgi:hypothetical protein
VRTSRQRASALIAILLAGCGGGGDDPPVASAPPDASPSPAPSPFPTTPPEPEDWISGALLANALRTPFASPVGVNARGNHGYVYQSVYTNTGESGGFYAGNLGDFNYSRNSFSYSIEVLEPNGFVLTFTEANELGSILRTSSRAVGIVELARNGSVRIAPTDNYAVGQLVAEWSSPLGYSRLLVQSDSLPSVFRACWHTKVPTIDRLVCSRHERATGQIVGLYILDNTPGREQTVWEGLEEFRAR